MPLSQFGLREPQPFEIRLDCRVKSLRLSLLLAPLGGEAGHLVLEGYAVVRLGLGSDVPAGREDVAVLAYLFQRRTPAEAGNVLVFAGVLPTASPGVVGVRDAGDVLRREVAMRVRSTS